MNVIDQANGSELPPALHRSSRRFLWAFALIVAIGLCVGGAYFGIDIEKFIEKPASREVAPMPAFSPEDRATLSEIRSGQQEASETIAELNRNIGAQQAELQRISDQIAALSSRIESLQNSAAPASLPPAPPPPPAQAVSKPAKRLVQPSKPEGPVSIGGAPLISEPRTDPH
ncbi:hypothetical protein [Bradyrhizobium neotropicale]|uniref:Uncharacterized protein n=1 Tax=Bradyrhizobium neotropicale TaxID=1497615 RepID=A0A176ZH36_9BRAD|nr:hypothetical protein [Bradyrhizobium neotropicale]OAF19193.1 hypothetical protein AXW67_37655 [Bradyrhizobium neotropicale]